MCIVYRRVVESLSDVFRLLCYVKKELMILWFILPALPLLLYIGTYLSSMFVYEHFGGPRSSIRFWGGTCHYHLNCVGMYLVLTIQGSSHTQGLNPQFLVGQTISNSIYHTFNLSALFAPHSPSFTNSCKQHSI